MSEKVLDQPTSAPTSPTTKAALFEPLVLVLLSLATVGTAWCSYEAVSWGGVAQGFSNRSGAASRTAAARELQAQQVALLDVALFSHYINARFSSNETLARFYSDRFRGEAKTAFDAWMATRPFENPSAPAHPFLTDFYHPRLLTEAQEAEADSQRLAQQASEAGRVSRGYVLITVLLACALFCGGTAAKFDNHWVRRGVLILGLVGFVFAVKQLWSLPAQL